MTSTPTPLHRLVDGVQYLALIAVAVVVVCMFALGPESSPVATADSGDGDGTPANPGADVFAARCASCHGNDGGGGVGPQLADRMVDAYPDIADQIALVANGRGGMPAFDGRLSEVEIEAVVEFTRTGLG